MAQSVIKIVEGAVILAGGKNMRVQELIHKKPLALDEVKRLRVSVTLDSNLVNDFLIHMDETFTNIEFSRTRVLMFGDNNPITEEWEIEVTLVGKEL